MATIFSETLPPLAHLGTTPWFFLHAMFSPWCRPFSATLCPLDPFGTIHCFIPLHFLSRWPPFLATIFSFGPFWDYPLVLSTLFSPKWPSRWSPFLSEATPFGPVWEYPLVLSIPFFPKWPPRWSPFFTVATPSGPVWDCPLVPSMPFYSKMAAISQQLYPLWTRLGPLLGSFHEIDFQDGCNFQRCHYPLGTNSWFFPCHIFPRWLSKWPQFLSIATPLAPFRSTPWFFP